MVSNCFDVNPFNVPCVPTGIKTGVLISACGNLKIHALALDFEHSAKMLNCSACVFVAILFYILVKQFWLEHFINIKI